METVLIRESKTSYNDTLSSLTKVNEPWTNWQKTGFRFLFQFFMLFIIVNNNGAYPYWDILMDYPYDVLDVIIPWIGKNIVSLPSDATISSAPTGSGDTMYDYLLTLVIFCLSIFGTVIWSVLDRKRTNYATLYYWLTVAVRFYIGLMLIHYGFIKVFKLQFPSPGLYRLSQPYGDSSPMGLAWTFLGFSKGYNLFMGFAEISAGLLLFRRTVALGAIITLVTTANIVAINFCYDVCVKLTSIGLFVMSAFLVAHDARRLFYFFLKNELVKLQPLRPPVIGKRWPRITMVTFKFLVIGYSVLYGGYTAAVRKYSEGSKPPLYGLYEVKSFTVANDTLPGLSTEKVPWKKMFIEYAGYARVGHQNDSMSRLFTKIDTTLHTMEFSLREDTTRKFHFRYEIPDKGLFVMKGMLQRDSVVIAFDHHTNFENRFLLTSRGFHWITETPFNR
jgi:hypothetical protein